MNGKNIAVIGGSKGIGAIILKNLMSQGVNVYNFSRTYDGPIGIPGLIHQEWDVIKEDLKQDQLPQVLDGLVYCPGSITLKPFRSLKQENLLADYEINVLGAVKALQACFNPLKRATGASVVLFSTVAVSQGMPFHASIAAAKGAIEGITRSLAAEWAPAIRVNCIAPSLTDTALAASLLSTPEKRTASDARHPLKRIGKPEDIAHAAVFLLSNQSSWITGQVMGVDGGMSTLRVP